MLVQVVSRVAVLVPLPDNNTAMLRVNPARWHPVQLKTQAGSTQCHVLLISFSIKKYVHDYVQDMYTKKVQSSIVYTSNIISYVSVWIFSLCIVRSTKQVKSSSFFSWGRFWPFVTMEISKSQELILSTPESRIKTGKITECLDSMTWRCFWCDFSLHFFLMQSYQIKHKKNKQVTPLAVLRKRRDLGALCYIMEIAKKARGKVMVIKRLRILEEISWGSVSLKINLV